jgi:hypothetical protein
MFLGISHLEKRQEFDMETENSKVKREKDGGGVRKMAGRRETLQNCEIRPDTVSAGGYDCGIRTTDSLDHEGVRSRGCEPSDYL